MSEENIMIYINIINVAFVQRYTTKIVEMIRLEIFENVIDR